MTIRSLLLAVSAVLWMQSANATQLASAVSSALARPSCMRTWIQVFDPSIANDTASQYEEFLLQTFKPIDEENAASSPTLGVSLLFGGMGRARGFVTCLSARTPQKCRNQAPCQHGGKCLFSSKSRLGAATDRAYECTCPKGFAGEFCQTVLSGCSRRPCQNGGTCQSLSSGRFKCVCPHQFSGRRCERQWLTEQMLSELTSSVNNIAKAVDRQEQRFTASRTLDWQRTANFLREMENRLEEKIDDRLRNIIANGSTLSSPQRASPGDPRSNPSPAVATECLQAEPGTEAVSRIYTHTTGNTSFTAMCNMTVDGGGWTMLMRSYAGGSTIFSEKNWNSYKNGFGSMARDFWLGNERAHLLTSSRLYEFRIDIRTAQGARFFFNYDFISIGNEAEKYKLTVGRITRSTRSVSPGDGMDYHNGMKFSTVDQDNDLTTNDCAGNAVGRHGGWWYNACFRVLPYTSFAKFSQSITNIVYFDLKIRPIRW